ncbi:P2Y purinoceptor 8-like [Paramacrobiotus metropolitanus]|uniref:P2Y purinoceptor 8-like n=1 Tax=Paramacrobiotus metropolitanus TaxID=2943436 RepID=UPI0024458368|nr:P2Y purinoceptor 8-like [Paramacrobiotus metropolitanus]
MAEPESNSTAPTVFDGNLTNVRWNVLAGLRIFTCTTTIWLNVALLSVFIVTKKLHTPFNTYLINLLIADIAYLTLSSFQGVIEWLKPNWWGGVTLCCLYKYGINTPAACMVWAQVLVTVNRLWAVTFPHSYRTRHTTRWAVGACVAMWAVMHLFYAPYLIMDVWRYPLPGPLYGCRINADAQPVYVRIIFVSMADFPVLFIVATYPYLLWKTVKRNRCLAVSSRRISAAFIPAPCGRPLDKEHRTAFLVLTLLTISVIIFLSPLPLVLMIGQATHVLAPGASFRATLWLLEIQAAADTVIIFVSVKDLRETISQALCVKRHATDRRFSRNNVNQVAHSPMVIIHGR